MHCHVTPIVSIKEHGFHPLKRVALEYFRIYFRVRFIFINEIKQFTLLKQNMDGINRSVQLNTVVRSVAENLNQCKTTGKRKHNTDEFTSSEEFDNLFGHRKLMKTRRTMPNGEQK